MIPAACLLLIAGFLAAIVYPILTAGRAWQRPSNLARQRLELTEEKEQLYSSIRELAFDHSLGKINDADYDQLREDLEGQALDALRLLDGLEAQPQQEDALSARIEADLKALSPVLSATTPPVATPAAKFCVQCGAARQETHKFCAACGVAFDTVSTAS